MNNLDNIKDSYRYILIDGSNMAKWFYHAPNQLCSESGHNTSMLYGILNYIFSTKRDYPKASIIFCWEGDHYSKRKTSSSTYKANRVKDNTYISLLQEVKDVITLAGVYQCFQPGLEADDMIGFFATQKRGRKLIVSRDRDLWQHVGEDVDIDLRRGSRTQKVFGKQTAESLEEYLGYPAANIIMYKILKGDTSDEVKGILRFPTALAEYICTKANTLSELKGLIQKDVWEPKYKKWKGTLKEQWEKLEENNYLMRFHPEWVSLEEMIKIKPEKNPKLLLKILQLHSMNSLIKKLRLGISS